MATIDGETPIVSIAYHQRIEDVVAALGSDALHRLTDLDARTRLLREWSCPAAAWAVAM